MSAGDGLFPRGGPGGAIADPIFTTIVSLPAVTLNEPVDVRYDTTLAGQLTGIAINCTAAGDNVLVAAVAGSVIRVYRMLVVFAAADTITLYDGAAGVALTGLMSMSQYGSIVLDFSGEAWFETTAGNAFVLNMTAGVQASGRLWYTVA